MPEPTKGTVIAWFCILFVVLTRPFGARGAEDGHRARIGPDPPDVISIDDTSQLFIDDYLVDLDRTTGLTRASFQISICSIR